jgi:alkylated DNA nucleotide flippase Atl1
MGSTRATEVAEVLWEIKRADKVATFTAIAERAGFSAGANGRTVLTVLRTVRTGWPHLEWWRAVRDDGQLDRDSEQQKCLQNAGFEVEECGGNRVQLKSLEEHLMNWAESQPGAATASE